MITSLRWCVLILALIDVARGQTQATRFEPVLDNREVSVFSLDLPAGRRAAVFQNTHDIFWITLSAGRVTMSDRDGQTSTATFAAGDARFYPSFATTSIANDAAEPFRAVLVEIKPRGLASSCGCDGAAQRAVCRCPHAAQLPQMWAVGVGSLVAGGTTLAPGESFRTTGNRGDTLLVAVTPVALADDASGPRTIELRAGQAAWMPAGRHRLRNVGTQPARYVTIEF